MKNLSIVSVLCLLMVGCSGMSTVGYKIEGGRYTVQRTVSDPHAFSPTTQRSWMEICNEKIDEEYLHCTRDGLVQFATVNGYLDGLGGAALYSAAIVGGAYFIGDGIRHSGSTTTNNTNQTGGGANQNQGQAQGQSQGQFQNQSQHGTVNGQGNEHGNKH